MLSGVSHTPIARALRQIVDVKPRGFMGIEKLDISHSLARTMCNLEIGDVIDSNPESLNASNLYRIKGIWTPEQVSNLVNSPDSNYLQSPSKNCYVVGIDHYYENNKGELFQWGGSHIDGIGGLPNYIDFHSRKILFARNKKEDNKSVPLPKIGDDVTVYDERHDDHYIEVENIISGPTLVHRLFNN